MIPLSLPDLRPAHPPIHQRDATGRNQDPPQRSALSEVRGREDGHADEDVAHAIHDRQAVEERPVRGSGLRLELEEGEGSDGPQHGVDAEADEVGGEEADGDAEVERL